MLRTGQALNLARAVQRVKAASGLHADAAGSAPAPAAARRRRLWELPPRALDMVLGVGLPHDALRRTAQRVLRSEPHAQGHELHAGLVLECRRRGALAEALHEELQRRHAAALRGAAALADSAALAQWWQACVGRGELPGALWAALSHAHCTPALEQRVLGEVQMLQFQAGQAARVELARFEALIDENAVVARLLAQAQARCTALQADHARERLALQVEVATLRGQVQGLQAALAEAAVPATLPGRAKRIAAHAVDAARTANTADVAHASHAADAAETADALAPPTPPAMGAPERRPAAEVAAATSTALDQRRVLCVGGRTASVPVYRRLVEACGGRFLHHDGGEEDRLGGLDATLSAADLVICQAGCISHNAYWRVKDHCKRTGKRCVFVETPSAAGLQRALVKISA